MDHTLPDLAPDPAAPPAPTPLPSRRRVLALVAVTGAGGALLVACGGSDTTTPGDSGGDGSTPAGSAGEGGGAGTALVATAKVPVGGGVILGGPRIVVTQPAQGPFKACSAVCTHQSCTVGMVKDNVITCPCHGSAYSATDGSVKNGPATRALRAIPITVDGGQVVES
jgi:nitrite reductase/ring-hydroxylating ferredoxin subunit